MKLQKQINEVHTQINELTNLIHNRENKAEASGKSRDTNIYDVAMHDCQAGKKDLHVNMSTAGVERTPKINDSVKRTTETRFDR